MPTKGRPRGRPRKPREEDYDPEPESPESNSLYKNIIVAFILFLIAGLFYLSSTGQAGMLGSWFQSSAHTLFGSIGYLFVPGVFALLAIIYVAYRSDPVPLKVPFGGILLITGFLTALHSLQPMGTWSGSFGALLGNPLLVASGTYISTLAAAALGIAGILLLPKGRELLEHMGLLVEKGTTRALHGASRLMSRRNANVGEHEGLSEDEDQYYDESEEEYEEYSEEDDYAEENIASPSPRPLIRPSTSEIKKTETAPQKPSLPVSPYVPPPLNLLAAQSGKANAGDIQHNALIIKQTLANFNIKVEMDEITTGPSITRYTMRPAQGLKLSRVLALRNELSLALAAHPIRIEAPIPGQSLIGIEIPNRSIATVGLRGLIEEPAFQKSNDPLTAAFGRSVSGKGFIANIAKIPHLMIAGTTGSGKSVAAHNLIISLLYRNGPDNLKLILVDPKRVELTLYNGIPHLLTPVIKDAKKAILALKWATKEMDRRYHTLEDKGVQNIHSYHTSVVTPAYQAAEKRRARGEDTDDIELPERMPYIVIIIDELADIMQAYPRELEACIVRLAQMSRAVGIHLILSTQRPEVRVITGLIKANVPGRMALRVASQIDSRTILDQPGAETLLGKGDMLFRGEGMNEPERLQSAFVSEDEIKNLVANIVQNNRGFPPDFIDIGDSLATEGAVVSESYSEGGDEDDDDLYSEAKELVIKTRVASTSFIQRKLRIGYARAARLIDILEERGVIGPSQGSKPREVLLGGAGQEDEYENESETDYEEE